MGRLQKRQLAVAVASAVWLWTGSPVTAQAPDPKLDALFAELAEPGRSDWMRIEAEITRIWSRSGSDAMDLLFQRGQAAVEAGDLIAAVEHFTALTDHAPVFAEGWNARATAYYLTGDYSLSIVDIERVLALNPRHFGALSGLAIILEELGEPELALAALREVQALNPNRDTVNQAVSRLERMMGATEL